MVSTKLRHTIMEKLFSTKTIEYYIRPDGLFYNKIITNRALDVLDIQDQLEICRQIYEKYNAKLLVISDLRNLKGMTKEARRYSQQIAPFEQYIGATAVLIKSGLSKMLGNILIGLNKGNYPNKLFTKEAEAVAWLEQFRT